MNSKSRSNRAGFQFPVGRIHRILRKGNSPSVSVPELQSTGCRHGVFGR
jgi:hypothetical protein